MSKVGNPKNNQPFIEEYLPNRKDFSFILRSCTHDFVVCCKHFANICCKLVRENLLYRRGNAYGNTGVRASQKGTPYSGCRIVSKARYGDFSNYFSFCLEKFRCVSHCFPACRCCFRFGSCRGAWGDGCIFLEFRP